MSKFIQAIKDGPNHFPETLPTPSAVKYAIIERHRNGWAAAGACVKLRGVWYLHTENYQAWLDQQVELAKA